MCVVPVPGSGSRCSSSGQLGALEGRVEARISGESVGRGLRNWDPGWLVGCPQLPIRRHRAPELLGLARHGPARGGHPLGMCWESPGVPLAIAAQDEGKLQQHGPGEAQCCPLLPGTGVFRLRALRENGARMGRPGEAGIAARGPSP